jgi:hypothetical protein
VLVAEFCSQSICCSGLTEFLSCNVISITGTIAKMPSSSSSRYVHWRESWKGAWQYFFSRWGPYCKFGFIRIAVLYWKEARIFDTLSTIMVSHSLYTYFVINFGNLAADGLIPWFANFVHCFISIQLILSSFPGASL